MSINGPIERDIPPPGGTKMPVLYLIEDMEVGDSRFFNADPMKVRPAVFQRAKRLGISMRTMSEGRGIRVWRVA